MAQQSLPYHSKSTSYIPNIFSANLAFCRELDLYRQPSFLRRNFRAFLAHHKRVGARRGSQSGPPQPQRAVNGKAARLDAVAVQDTTLNINGESPAETGDETVATKQIDAVSKDTLMAKTMDPDFEAPARRSVRHLTQRVFDEDEAELTLEPLSIRKKINFSKNQPPPEDRPRKRFKTDRSVQRTKCHCSLTIWDNRDGLEEAAAALIETHMSCMAIWSHTEQYGHVVDIEMDKPFQVKARHLKVPITKQGDTMLGVSDNYFMEIKIWPSSEKAEWPPIPLLGKSDGDVNRPNRIAHNILSGSLVAKYKNLPRQPEADTPLSIFYLDESGAMLRTKYGLEVSGDWKASEMSLDSPPIRKDLAEWALDDNDNFLGRNRKRPRAQSSPKTQPRRRKQLKPTPRTVKKQSRIQYLWEPDPSQSHLAQDEYQTTEFLGLICPACPTYEAQDLWELRFHFLSSHSRFNFILQDEDYDHDKGLLCTAFFRVSSTIPSQRRLEDSKVFSFQAPTDPFDLTAYLQGDTSWTSESPQKGPPKRGGRPPAVHFDSSSMRSSRVAQPGSIEGFVEDPFVALRAKHNGHLPPGFVPEFRKSERKKFKPARLVRHTDTKTQAYDSISHRPTYASEDSMSETDDERDSEWYIQRHLEMLAVDGENYGRSDSKQELFQRWDKHRLEERLDNTAFLSESLIRFVRKHKHWLRNGDASLKVAWHRLLDNLMEDKLIDTEVVTWVQGMIFAKEDKDNGSAEANTNGAVPQDHANGKQAERHSPPSPSMQLEDSLTMGLNDNNSLTKNAQPLPPPAPTEPAAALEALRAKLRLTLPDHCGICQKHVADQLNAARCVARDCESSTVFYHLECARLREKKPAWQCLACRAAAKLAKERREEKGKGKALDGGRMAAPGLVPVGL